jgi:hypothetical protein
VAAAPEPVAAEPEYEPAPEPAPDADSMYEVAPQEAPAPSLGYYTAPVGGEFKPLKQRSIVPFCVVAGLMFLMGITMTVLAVSGSMTPSINNSSGAMQTIFIAVGASCGFLLLAIPTLILWLVWVGGTHADLKQMTGGSYDISPGKAIGFSFIPFFDAFWVVYMPWRLSAEVNRHLAARGLPPISSNTVMGCQIASVVAALILPALTPVMYAVSMWQVQGGLNRLLAAP